MILKYWPSHQHQYTLDMPKMDWRIGSFFLIIFQFVSVDAYGGEYEYFVTAFPDGDQCPSYADVCHNLTYYQETYLFQDNSVYLFLPGTHRLPAMLNFSGLFNVTFQGLGTILHGYDETVTYSTSVLQCDEGHVEFQLCDKIRINRLTINHCQSKSTKDSEAALMVFNSVTFEINELTILNSNTGGLYLENVQNMTIKSSVFAGNYYGIFSHSIDEYSNLSISDTNMTYNVIGLELQFHQYNNTAVQYVTLESCNTIANLYNVFTLSTSCYYHLQFNNLVSKQAQLYGFFSLHAKPCYYYDPEFSSIVITNSHFTHNNNPLLLVLWSSYSYGFLSIASSSFIKNVAVRTIDIQQVNDYVYESFYDSFFVQLSDLVVEQNVPAANSSYQVSLFLVSIKNMIISNCTFNDNVGPAIHFHDSTVKFIGKNIFTNNTATNGGAISLFGDSFILLKKQSQLVFKNNHATQYGGAIYITSFNRPSPGISESFFRSTSESSESSDITKSKFNGNGYCFFQLLDQPSECKVNYDMEKSFVFINNTANIAGSVLYGGFIDDCYAPYPYEINNTNQSECPLDFYFNMTLQSGGSVISSQPQQVCFCESNEVTCTIQEKNFEVYPGETILLKIAVIGNHNGLTTGTVKITSSTSRTRIFSLNNASCNIYYYTVSVNDPTVNSDTIRLSIVNRQGLETSNEIVINVKILTCPVDRGFKFSESSKSCECVQKLTNNKVTTCDTSTLTIIKEGELWMDYNENQSCMIVHDNCPFDYCNFTYTNISIDDPDSQCAYERTGLLCGKCPDHLSLVLGSNACKDCSGVKNTFILLVIPFTLAGIGLVVLLIFLNLTVSVGTINGLVFFANLVKIYATVFQYVFTPIPVINQFISWINLDFGIETCFFDKMDAIWKIGIQFLFPFYLWLIILVVIVLSRYFDKIAKLVGNSAVPVLATLILLSYTKLIRTVLLILSRVQVECGSDTTNYWFVDPTQQYFSGGHTVLFIVAILVLILFIVPYTLFLLLLYPLLERSNESVRQKFSWFLFKLKPFFDAYRGPHTDNFSFWPGVLLVFRIVIALLVALTDNKNISVTVSFPLFIILLMILSSGKIYKQKILSFLDAMFVSIILIFGYLLILEDSGSSKQREKFVNNIQELQTGTFVFGLVLSSISFITFLGILAYHTYQYTFIGNRFRSKLRDKRLQPTSSVQCENLQMNVTFSECELREALLESSAP